MFHDRIQSVNFALYTSDEIKQLSVRRITSTETFDVLGHPVTNGLCDPVLGPAMDYERCETCGLSSVHCPGHFGHIELPLPIYHPMFYKLMIKLLRGSCFTCHRLITKLSVTHLFVRYYPISFKNFLSHFE